MSATGVYQNLHIEGRICGLSPRMRLHPKKAVHVCHKTAAGRAGLEIQRQPAPPDRKTRNQPATADRVLHTSRRDCARPFAGSGSTCVAALGLAVATSVLNCWISITGPDSNVWPPSGAPCSTRPLTTSSRRPRNELYGTRKLRAEVAAVANNMCDLRATLNGMEHRYRFDSDVLAERLTRQTLFASMPCLWRRTNEILELDACFKGLRRKTCTEPVKPCAGC